MSKENRLIPLTQNKCAIVDKKDYEWLSKYKWFLNRAKYTFYAQRKITLNSKTTSIYMHRLILGLKKRQRTDHINRNGLDNRRANLRICTISQNLMNMRKVKGTSKYKGVSRGKQYKKWRVQIQSNYKKRFIGYFVNEIEAAKAYDNAAIKYFGEFANLNFPEKEAV